MQSYSQNLEDVLLDRCFRNQKSGIYVDVGAGPGDGYSVTKNLYLQGWSGVLIEPVPAYAEFHHRARPRDTVIAVAAGEEDCEIEFQHFLNTGLSTKKMYVLESRQDSYSSEVLVLQQLTLRSILKNNDVSHIDLLKIDVEGSEMEVLLGLDFDRYQPRLIIVEATRPLSRIRISDDIREFLTNLGYEFALFDGLNDYFVFGGEQQLMDALNSPVNVFDGDFFKNSGEVNVQNRIRELEIRNLVLDQQVLQVGREKEKIEYELDSQRKILDWHQTHLYVLDNSIRMKIGTFVVMLLFPFKPIVIRFLSLLRLFRNSRLFQVKRRIRLVARVLLRQRVIRFITVFKRVTRLRVLGFWGWKSLRVKLKTLVSGLRTLVEKKPSHFDAEQIQTRAGISRSGFEDIEIHAFETLKRDLDDLENRSFSANVAVSNIIVDVRCIQSPDLAARGIGKHANFIVNEITLWAEELNLEVRFLVSPENEIPNFLKSSSFLHVLPENTDSTIFFQLSSMTENPISSLPILLNERSYKVGIFYDFIPKHNPGYYLWGRSAKALYEANLATLKLYDEFWAISNSVSHELRGYLQKFSGHQPQVIPTGVSAKIPGSQDSHPHQKRVDVLIPTGGDARKDPLTALAALVIMKENASIERVIVIGHLPQKAKKELEGLVRGTWIAPKLTFLAPTSFDDIALAYSKAKLTLVTSLDEGYSLPIVESISMKVPVLGSRIPAHRELLKNEFLFKPKNYFQAARKIQLALETDEFTQPSDYLETSQLLVAENIIPERLSVLNSKLVIAPKSNLVKNFASENSIAVVSPWPPLRTGIADYSESTLNDPAFRIVCSDAYNTKNLELHKWNWCEIAKSKRLFVLGNNHNFHSSAMYALIKMGGNVLIHDTRILDMWNNLFGTNSFDYMKKFKTMSRDDFDSSFMNLDEAASLGFEPLIPSVHRFITHSAILKEHLKSIGAKNVYCIPFASRNPNMTNMKSSQEDQTDFVIGVFGITDIKTKHFDLIYEACSELAVAFPNIRLVCVGELLNDAANFLDQNSRRNASWLYLKGRVEESEYWELLTKCHITIHIRKIKKLSLSGAVMDSLTVGTPVICSESILSEMQIPLGLPYSVCVGNDSTSTDLQNVLTELIQQKLMIRAEELVDFAKSRDNGSYIRKLKAALELNEGF